MSERKICVSSLTAECKVSLKELRDSILSWGSENLRPIKGFLETATVGDLKFCCLILPCSRLVSGKIETKITLSIIR
jgi:hypothetical protein